MKLSVIKSISLTFIISTALSLPSFAKVNDNNQAKINPNLNAKFNIVQGYWKISKCINDEENSFPVKFKVKSFQIYLQNTKINNNSFKIIAKAQLFKKKDCLGKPVIYLDNHINSGYKSDLSKIKFIDKNHLQDKYNKDIAYTRITKAEYDKLK